MLDRCRKLPGAGIFDEPKAISNLRSAHFIDRLDRAFRLPGDFHPARRPLLDAVLAKSTAIQTDNLALSPLIRAGIPRLLRKLFRRGFAVVLQSTLFSLASRLYSRKLGRACHSGSETHVSQTTPRHVGKWLSQRGYVSTSLQRGHVYITAAHKLHYSGIENVRFRLKWEPCFG